MTEKRIVTILAENGAYPTDILIEAMKQAVNEAIMESIGLCYENLVDKPIIDEIRNLKVK